MRKLNINFLFIFALIFLFCTCNDPVFFAITQEVKPIPPRIKGRPTNFTVYNDRMYVASGIVLYSYNKGEEKPYWNKEDPPGGNIMQIASTGSYLYALCTTDRNNDKKTVIKYYNKDDLTWTQVSGMSDNYEKIHNIYSAGDIIFFYATASKDNYAISYAIFYIDNSGTVQELKTQDPALKDNTGEINGAAFNGTSYFLSTKDKGVYRIDDLNIGAYLFESNINFSGIINLEDNNNTILLIARNGDAYTVNDSIVRVENVSMGKMSTGALAIWRENELPSSEKLLLSGRQDSLVYSLSFGYTYGYLELKLDLNGIESGANFVEPGINSLSSVSQGNNERYQSTLGKQPVNYLFQVPYYIDSNMTMFASTQKNGVWSYRDRGGLFQWNAEGENEP